MISTALILIGTVGAVLGAAQLGCSFSVMAETRQLVIAGPYRFVRHPLYLTEQIATFGLFMQFASAWTALVLALQNRVSVAADAQRGTDADCELPRIRRLPTKYHRPDTRGLLTMKAFNSV